jgi:ABC-type polysaccharide/polyol phosphate transport system, ATPase component
MSSDRAAVRIRGLAKAYRLGGRRARPTTFVEALSGFLRHPLARHDRPILWALDGIDLDVAEGEILGIVGANGAGKSTLLKVLSRITSPTRGRVELFGRVGSLLEVGTGFHPELTGRENIYLNATILGMRRREVAGVFDEIVEFAGVERFLDTPVKRYSSGMYVRLAFSVAAHLRADILLIDEVLAVGDLAFQQRCLGKMREVATAGRTVFFVSHNMDSIGSLCRSAIWLDGGKIRHRGPAGEVVHAYASSRMESLAGTYEAPPGETADDARLERAVVLGADRRPCSRLRFGEPFTIAMTWRLRVPVPGISYTARLTDDRGRLVTVLNTVGLELRADVPGLHHLECEVPVNPLVPGDYRVAVGAWVRPSTRVHTVDDCLVLRIGHEPHDPGHRFTAVGNPLVAVPCRWSHRPASGPVGPTAAPEG